MPLTRRPLLPNEPDYERWFVFLFPLTWIAAGIRLFLLPQKLPPCPLHHFSGIPCPGCGSTRATVALAHGDFLRALAFNPLWVLICLAALLLWLYSLRVVLGGKPRWRCDHLTRREIRLLRLGFILLLLANWGWVLFREFSSAPH